VRNAADRKQIKKAKQAERARLERERNEDLAVWSTVAGRAYTRRLLAECGVFRTSMAADPHWTAYNEGGRNVGLRLLARMTENAPELYALMEREHIERQRLEPVAPEPMEPEESEDSDDTTSDE